MSIDVWIFAKPAEWAALTTEVDGEIVPFNYPHNQAVTGYWKPYTGGFEVFNVWGTEAQIQAIIDALPTPPPHVFSWTQGDGMDSIDNDWPTDPTVILSVMKDHVEYDENGDVVSTTPATREAPNWGHIFTGQKGRIFAGSFDNSFDRSFR